MIKTILFDFDGTIGDTFRINVDSIIGLGNKLGYKAEYADDYKNYSLKEIVTKKVGIPKEEFDNNFKELKGSVSEKAANCNIFSGLKEVIEILSKKYKIGIISSNKESTIAKFLEKNEIDCVEFVFTGDKLFDKHIAIEHALKKYDLVKEETVYVGDEIKDIEACTQINLKLILVSWGYNSRKMLEARNPETIIDTPKELLDII